MRWRLSWLSSPVLVSRFFAAPIYDVFSRWKAESPPEDWREARDLNFRVNAVRGLGSGAALFYSSSAWSLYSRRERRHHDVRPKEEQRL